MNTFMSHIQNDKYAIMTGGVARYVACLES